MRAAVGSGARRATDPSSGRPPTGWRDPAVLERRLGRPTGSSSATTAARGNRRLRLTASAFDALERHISQNGVPSGNGGTNGQLLPDQDGIVTSPQQTEATEAPKTAEPKKEEPQKEFTNTNRFYVPMDLIGVFEAAWRQREAAMQKAAGFVELSVRKEGQEFVISSRWQSIPLWEAWSCSFDARKSHFPTGIYQYVPKKGEGFPEDFVPFIKMDMAVNAKY